MRATWHEYLMLETILAYLVSAMVAWTPEGQAVDSARYSQIANDAWEVATNSPVFDSNGGVLRTALLLLSIASYESSGYRQDIDEGRVRGDHGQAVCLGQVHVYGPTRERVARNRRLCFSAMIAAIRYSLEWCRYLKPEDRLGGYTIGQCKPSRTSRERWTRANRWWVQWVAPPPSGSASGYSDSHSALTRG